ncbi:MAG: amidohydrolase family protein, partial [Alphaproteobacteria bacterium]|nr:amidohydrolase family protein [Alphaproteobacteria bacterium]
MVRIDCDVHNFWHSAEVLLPYLASEWQDQFNRGEMPGPRGSLPYANRAYLLSEGFKRMDIDADDMNGWIKLTQDHLDLYDIDYGILTSDEPLEVSTLSNPHYAAALVSAYNDWQADTWLKADKRFKGSIVISPTAPDLAAQEIRRVAGNQNMVQVLSSEG